MRQMSWCKPAGCAEETTEVVPPRGSSGCHHRVMMTVSAATGTTVHAGFHLNPAESLVSLVVSVICVVACVMIAGRKGRSQVLWGILGFFFSIITLIVIALLPASRSNAR